MTRSNRQKIFYLECSNHLLDAFVDQANGLHSVDRSLEARTDLELEALRIIAFFFIQREGNRELQWA